jgi:hypothetical protein
MNVGVSIHTSFLYCFAYRSLGPASFFFVYFVLMLGEQNIHFRQSLAIPRMWSASACPDISGAGHRHPESRRYC